MSTWSGGSASSWLVDLNQVITHVAIETFLAEFDGFLGGSGMANFYLYRPVATNVHRLIAWDRDTTFQDIDSPIFARAEENALYQPGAAVRRSTHAVSSTCSSNVRARQPRIDGSKPRSSRRIS